MPIMWDQMRMKIGIPLTLTLSHQGGRKEKIKDEILTPLKTEGERARGGEGEKKIKN